VWGLSPATDQQLGGLVMWVPVSIIYIVIASILFIRWMQEQDARQRAQEASLYMDEVEGEEDGAEVL
jgi:cytochrome c oxidase assembly factor CtaG